MLDQVLNAAALTAGAILFGFFAGLGFLGAFTLVDAIQSRRRP